MEQKNNSIEKIFDFASLIAALKKEERFKSTPNIKGDTVAAHSWRLAILTFLFAEELNLDIDVLRAVKIALVHDFPEIVTGDLDASAVFGKREVFDKKQEDEKAAVSEVINSLSNSQGGEIEELWREYFEKKTREGRFVYALDKLEGAYTYLEQEKDEYDNPELEATYCASGYEIFPELKPVIDCFMDKLKADYESKGIVWKEEYDKQRLLKNLK